MPRPVDNDGAYFHDRAIEAQGALNDPEAQRQAGLEAQHRAALVLSAVGSGWNGQQVFFGACSADRSPDRSGGPGLLALPIRLRRPPA